MGPESKEPPAEALAHALAIEESNPCPEATTQVKMAALPLIANADDWQDFNVTPGAFAGDTSLEDYR